MSRVKSHDNEYLDLVEYVIDAGVYKPNRTGVGAYSLFAQQMKFDLRDGTIPLLTTKKMHTRSIFHEIIWYLSGDTNIKYLKDNNVTIWDEWADEKGDLGPVYGKQWRDWETYEYCTHPEADIMSPNDWGNAWFPGHSIDQIARVIHLLRTDPNNRRMIVSAWNVAELDKMALPPCHYSFQFFAKPLNYFQRLEVANLTAEQYTNAKDTLEKLMDEELKTPKYELSLLLNQRSCDVGLGVPFNIAQYSTLLYMVAQVTGMSVGDFVWSGGDVHVYENHISALEEQLKRKPFASPKLVLNKDVKEIDDFKFEDFQVVDYICHPTLKMDVAV